MVEATTSSPPQGTSDDKDSSKPLDQLFTVTQLGTRSVLFPFTHSHTPVLLTTTVEETFQRVAEALQEQRNLEHNHAVLSRAFDSGNVDSVTIETALAQSEKHAAGIRGFLSSCLNSIPVSMRPTTASASKAQRVFNTVELLEAILINLHPYDLLSALQVNGATSKMIETTPKLHDVLHLRPSKDGFLNTIFSESWGPFFRLDVTYSDVKNSAPLRHETIQQDDHVNIFVTFDVVKGTLRVGELCRRMLVCQPPVKVMEISASCCDIHHSWSYLGSVGCHVNAVDSSGIIRSEAGLTVGDLYDKAVELQEKHLYCPHASQPQHCEDGTVRVEARFHGQVELKKDDPYLVGRTRPNARGNRKRVPNDAKEQKLQDYIKAKKAGKTMRTNLLP